ncbi:hypothetical protein EVAR_89269_1 [Eumeta japonica]|uniref:Uncharacterized protein n=1 Tax=Eumeta variegata TaxID=151549 RepID=A0A4C1VL76_EUMVA|nr:hypothetical protein EVAR_89269_1 [Eumeta japonica]
MLNGPRTRALKPRASRRYMEVNVRLLICVNALALPTSVAASRPAWLYSPGCSRLHTSQRRCANYIRIEIKRDRHELAYVESLRKIMKTWLNQKKTKWA